MKILILGHGQHGKDAVASLFHKHHGLTFISSSLAALEVIWPCLQEIKGYETKEEAYEDRRNNRELWKRLISLYNASDHSALCKKIIEKSDIYVGMRCNLEYECSKYLFDKIYYIDASERIKEKDSTMLIDYDSELMELIDNNQSLVELDFYIKSLDSCVRPH